MSRKIKLALLQIHTGPSKMENLEKVGNIIENFEERPDIVITPEYLMGLEEGRLTKEFVREKAENLGSRFVNFAREKAREAGISLLFTTYREGEGYFNTSIFVDESGKILANYDEIHLFDAFGYEESEILAWEMKSRFLTGRELGSD